MNLLKNSNFLRDNWRFILGAAIFTVVFMINSRLPLGFAVWMIDIVVLAMLYNMSERQIRLLTVYGSLLIIVSFALARPGVLPAFAVYNRTVGLVTFWIIAFLLIKRQRNEKILLETIRKSERDMDELKRAEEALRRSQVDLSRAQEVGQIGSWRLDVKRNVLTWSEEAFRIFGIPEGTSLTYETFLSAVHPDDRDYVDTKWKAALAGAPYDIDHRIITGGRTKWVREKAFLESDDSGQMLGGYGITQDITQRRQAEEALRRRESELASITANSPDIIARYDLELRHAFINPYGEKVYGKKRDEIIGRSNADLGMPPGKAGFWSKQLNEVIETGEQRNFEFDFDSPLGRQHFLSVLVPEFDNEGRVSSVLAIARDITGLKRLEEGIKNAEEHLRLALEAGKEGTFDHDLVSGKIFWGELSREFFCVGSEEGITFEKFLSIVHPEDRDRLKQAFINAIAPESDGRFDIEFLVVCPKGHVRWISAKGQAYFREEGGVRRAYRLIGTNVDVTERKKIEEQLQASENQLRYSFEQYQIALSAADLGTMIYYPDSDELILDARGRGLLDFKENEPVNLEKVYDSVSVGDMSRVKTGMAAVKREEGEIDLEFRLVSSKGAKWLSLKGRSVGTMAMGQKSELRFAGMIMDITRRKEAEDVLRRDRELLNRLVSERSYKLLETQKELDRSRRLSDIGQLAATVAHELRNPLAAIHMAGSNIRRRAQNTVKLEGSLGTIDKKVAESDQIISNLLFYARVRIPHFEQVCLREVLEDSVRTSRARFKQRKAEVDVDAGNLREMTVEADPLQVKELLVNVINNAFDALAEDREGRIRIKGGEDTGAAKVIISDNGVGIKPHDLEHIFEPFFTTKTKGTGLGLAVCRQIVEAHRGNITVNSEPGKGTEIIIVLPKHQPV